MKFICANIYGIVGASFVNRKIWTIFMWSRKRMLIINFICTMHWKL